MVSNEIINKAKKEYEDLCKDLQSKYLKTISIKAEKFFINLHEYPHCELGAKIQIMDAPKTEKECLSLLRDYLGQKWLGWEKCYFIQRYGNYSKLSIKKEIENIKKFISHAKSQDYGAACNYKDWYKLDDQYEYLRLEGRYYENAMIPFETVPLWHYNIREYRLSKKRVILHQQVDGKNYKFIIEQPNPMRPLVLAEKRKKPVILLRDLGKKFIPVSTEDIVTAQVYGRYFLFYDFLKTELKKIQQQQKEVTETESKNVIVPPANEKNIVDEGLSVFSRKWPGGDKIMTAEEYKRLIDYFKYTLDHKKLPEKIIPIGRSIATSEFIQHTFYIFWKKNKFIISRKLVIDFLHSVFEQFFGISRSTTEKKFAKKFNGYDDFIKNLPK